MASRFGNWIGVIERKYPRCLYNSPLSFVGIFLRLNSYGKFFQLFHQPIQHIEPALPALTQAWTLYRGRSGGFCFDKPIESLHYG